MILKSEDSVRIIVWWTICFLITNGQPLSVNCASNITRDDTKVFKLPTTLQNETVIIINGIINNDSQLQLKLTSKRNKKENYCKVVYDPKDMKLTVMSQIAETSSEYVIGPQSANRVNFTFRLEAKSAFDLEKFFIHMYFESNGAGEHALEPCEFQSLSDMNGLVFNGAKQVLNLNFEYGDI